MSADLIDVLIVGGGPAGACLGALLAKAGGNGSHPLQVVILESRRPAARVDHAPLQARVVAVSRASQRILNAAGAWKLIEGPRICAYERMRVWHESTGADHARSLEFDAADAGEPNLGYIVENGLLQTGLLQAFSAAGGRFDVGQFKSLDVRADRVVVATNTGSLSARLIVGADGADSAVRAAIGLTAQSSDYHQSGIVALVATEHPHRNTAWQRFMHDGTLAFLPLPDGTSSIVWSADEALAARLLAGTVADFALELDRASDLALGKTCLVSERVSFPLRRLSAHRYTVQRCALIGDAAHVVHPLAGQGVNLGLLDAAALAQTLLDARRHSEDPGAVRVLRQYERWRKSELAFFATAIDGFDRYLAHGSGPLAQLARRGLAWVNRSQEAKRFFISRALGLSGELPRCARQ